MTTMFNPAHPGEVLREFLTADMTQGELADKLQVSRVQLSRVLNGRSAVSADMAIRIGKLTGTTPESWLGNQMQWDLWQAHHKPRATTHSKVPTTFGLRGGAAAIHPMTGSVRTKRKAKGK